MVIERNNPQQEEREERKPFGSNQVLETRRTTIRITHTQSNRESSGIA